MKTKAFNTTKFAVSLITIGASILHCLATTYTLNVISSNPNSGVSIIASPNDNNGKGGGTTPFTLTYDGGAVVTLSPPGMAGSNDFYQWQQGGATYVCCGSGGSSGTAVGAIVTVNSNQTMTAVYGGIGIIALTGNLAFGTVQTGAQAVRQFTVQSQGGYQPLHVSGLTNPPGFNCSWSGTIPINGSTNIYVTFSPTNNGSYGGMIGVISDATVGPNSIAVSGTAVTVAASSNAFPVDAFDTIYTFTGYGDGGAPCTGLVQDPSGYLYGTTTQGGGYGNGAIFRLTPSGTNSVLYSFRANGGGPGAQLTLGSDGNLYGTKFSGGAHGNGSVFKIASRPLQNGVIFA